MGERNNKCPLKQTRASAIINEFILVQEYSYNTISRTLWYLFLLYHKRAARNPWGAGNEIVFFKHCSQDFVRPNNSYTFFVSSAGLCQFYN